MDLTLVRVKKLLVVLVLAGLGVVVYAKVFRAVPAEKMCAKIDDLCGGEKIKPGECREGVAEARKVFGEDAIDRAISCVDDAKSCMEAVGCVMGAGMRSFEQLQRGVERGFGK
jgi:hypothetical protein